MIPLIAAAGIAGAVISLISMKKSKHFIKMLFLTVVQGVTALLAVNASGMITGVSLSVNALTVGSGVLFGTPGVIMNLLTQIILA